MQEMEWTSHRRTGMYVGKYRWTQFIENFSTLSPTWFLYLHLKVEGMFLQYHCVGVCVGVGVCVSFWGCVCHGVRTYVHFDATRFLENGMSDDFDIW